MRQLVDNVLCFGISPSYIKPIKFTESEIYGKDGLKEITVQQYGGISFVTLFVCKDRGIEIPVVLWTALADFLPHDFTIKRSIRKMRYAK